MAYGDRVNWKRWALAVLLLCSMPSTPVLGQSFPLIYGGTPSGITRGDIDLIEQAVAPLFMSDTIGEDVRWQNDTSGNSGTVRLRKIYELKGMSCREFLYTTRYRAKKQPSATKIDWCRTPSGEWKFVDPAELRGG